MSTSLLPIIIREKEESLTETLIALLNLLNSGIVTRERYLELVEMHLNRVIGEILKLVSERAEDQGLPGPNKLITKALVLLSF